jgi:hypothetical protein
MTEPAPTWPIDRRLHAINRGALTALSWIAGGFLLLWLLDTWATWDTAEQRDATWFVSGAIRCLAFAALALLAFIATFRSQPRGEAARPGAQPTSSVIRLRVIAGVAAALFFGDLAASAYADVDGGWITRVQAALLAAATLAAVVSVATGRAVIRLWKDTGGDRPVWREPTELETARVLPSIGAHTIWLGTFLVGWLLGEELPSLVPLATAATGATFSLTIESVMISGIGALYAAKRELLYAGRLRLGRHPLLDRALTLLGLALSAELGGRLLMARPELEAFSFWFGAAICAGGVLVALYRMLGRMASSKPTAD